MINVAVGGASGKMGRTVCEMILNSSDMRLTGAMVAPEESIANKEIFPGVIAYTIENMEKALKGADVYVDITAPSAAAQIIGRIPSMGVNMVIGTTSIPKDAVANMIKEVSGNGTSAVMSANYAIGVNVFWKMCQMLAEALDGYDIEVIETHHNQKKDAPSGTAMEAVRRIREVTGINDVIYGREGVPGARGKEICVHSVRAGDVVGDHTVIFAGNKEIIEIKHKAISRDVFAGGFIKAIRWVYGKKDGAVHEMSEVLEL
ncbi:MAG: 4-hydroxy-tetrahydrodipicolinate reductase [Methanomassiliicoccaceae archaeon]|jgi:4-hydroxy-tetrahydrodipicolinate reductase|nr:4-hydroxy-tetrahydrodipicolinate reductase [Methanomassiliicoccaceae archaeon]